MTLKVALDHNFPDPIIRTVGDAIVEAELRPIKAIDARLRDVADDVLVHALAHRGWNVLVTCDQRMLDIHAVLARILETRMTVVATIGQGHDPVMATGLVLAYLPHILKKYERDTAQVWRLRAGRRPHEDPWQLLAKIATREKTTAKAIYEANKVGRAKLAFDPLDTE